MLGVLGKTLNTRNFIPKFPLGSNFERRKIGGGSKARAFMGWLVVLGSVLITNPAWACPACALNDRGGWSSFFLLGSMIILPFFVVGIAFWMLKRTISGLSSEHESLGDRAGNYARDMAAKGMGGEMSTVKPSVEANQ